MQMNFALIKSYSSNNWIIKKYDAFSRHFLRIDYIMSRTLKDHDIDVLFPGKMSPGGKIATIYWIPDFQFLHLPHLYQQGQAERIKTNLQRYFRDASLIIVSSNDALSDMERFFPGFLGKTRVVSFVAHVPVICTGQIRSRLRTYITCQMISFICQTSSGLTRITFW